MAESSKTLASMNTGEKVVIDAIDTTDPHVRRLMTLGLVEGAEIEHATSALGGDPIEFILFGQAISMRREQARAFSVSPVGVGE
ncbi:MAG: FeoA family protein [Woeseiaceae bacterium]|nr:FeoA family protein [Woeseiaceae bacterium]